MFVPLQALKALRTAEFKPYVIFVKPRIPESRRRRSAATSPGGGEPGRITVSLITGLQHSALKKPHGTDQRPFFQPLKKSALKLCHLIIIGIKLPSLSGFKNHLKGCLTCKIYEKIEESTDTVSLAWLLYVFCTHLLTSLLFCSHYKYSYPTLSHLHIFQEEDLQEMRLSAQQIDQQYGHLVDRVLIKEDTASACAELRSILERLERETFWVPMSWVKA